ncbi:MAG: ligase-associated DNA damage response exonuclease [Opitutales bacterium]
MYPNLEIRPEGLYCPEGDFFVDPHRPVGRAVITHGHADHAQWGCGYYLGSASGGAILKQRLGKAARIETLPYGVRRRIGGIELSLHPAGHIRGSAQVRLGGRAGVTVISGDYKTAPDATCEAFEPVPCDAFISECTFGLPIYRWPETQKIAEEINAWWQQNREEGRTSIIYAYALGKAQRVLSLLDGSIGPVGVHGSVAKFLPIYATAGAPLPPWVHVRDAEAKALKGNGLVVAPGSVQGTPWERKLGPLSRASASGWMAVRGNRRRSALDRGFVLSDHCDWPGLLSAFSATGARHIGLTHGDTEALSRYLNETTELDVSTVPGRFTREVEVDPEA